MRIAFSKRLGFGPRKTDISSLLFFYFPMSASCVPTRSTIPFSLRLFKYLAINFLLTVIFFAICGIVYPGSSINNCRTYFSRSVKLLITASVTQLVTLPVTLMILSSDPLNLILISPGLTFSYICTLQHFAHIFAHFERCCSLFYDIFYDIYHDIFAILS